MKRFGIIGAAGYVAPRHMKAIMESGGNLIAALDKNDSVGVIDTYFPDAAFFTEFERFDRHLEKLKRQKTKIDYLSICSPNYLHDAHIRFGLRHGTDVICEKPLVLNPWNIDALSEMEKETGNVVYTILQLRLHESIKKLKEEFSQKSISEKLEIDLTYITSRGNWYYASWKGIDEKSGGIATNIGIHFFDMLGWLFGTVEKNIVHLRTHDRAAGYLEFENARVRWFLSIDRNSLPEEIISSGGSTYRSMTLNGNEIEFSIGFNDLHTDSYKEIINGRGFSIEEGRQSIEIAHQIRHAEVLGLNGEYHPFAKKSQNSHPFFRIK